MRCAICGAPVEDGYCTEACPRCDRHDCTEHLTTCPACRGNPVQQHPRYGKVDCPEPDIECRLCGGDGRVTA